MYILIHKTDTSVLLKDQLTSDMFLNNKGVTARCSRFLCSTQLRFVCPSLNSVVAVYWLQADHKTKQRQQLQLLIYLPGLYDMFYSLDSVIWVVSVKFWTVSCCLT